MLIRLVVFLTFFMPLLGIMLAHSTYFFASNKYRGLNKSLSSERRVTIIVPVKNEPLELIEGLIDGVENSCSKCELLIISDDPEERFSKIKDLCDSKARELQKTEVRLLTGDPVNGNRVKALNRGVTEAKYEYILVLDVDSRPEKGFIDRLVECVESGYDACVGRWDSYQSISSRLAISISRVMKFTVDALYKGRSALNLFIFPLGSGTLFRKNSLLTVGLWDDVIQDDMYIGMKLFVNGFKTNYVDDAMVKVLVPSTFESLRIQQGRWAYGALEVLRKTYKQLIRSRVGVLKKLEAALFLGQYIPASLLFLGSLIVPLTAVLLRDDIANYGLALMTLSGAAILTYAVGLYRSLISKYARRSVVIRTMGSSAAITIALLPTIFTGTLKSLLGKKIYYRVTPKGSHERMYPTMHLKELIYLTYLAVVSVINLLVGNTLTALWSTSMAVAIVYVMIRSGKLVA